MSAEYFSPLDQSHSHEPEPQIGQIVIEKQSGELPRAMVDTGSGVVKHLVILRPDGRLLFEYNQNNIDAGLAGFAIYQQQAKILRERGIKIAGIYSVTSTKSGGPTKRFVSWLNVPPIKARKLDLMNDEVPPDAVQYTPITKPHPIHLHLGESEVTLMRSIQESGGKIIGNDDVASELGTLSAMRELQENNGFEPVSDVIVAAIEVPATLTSEPQFKGGQLELAYQLHEPHSIPGVQIHHGFVLPLINVGEHAEVIGQFLNDQV